MSESELKKPEAVEPPSSQPEQPPPEPEFELSPEILRYENRRNDLVIAIGVLAMAFFLGALREGSSDFFLRLHSGRLIAATFPTVPKTDSLSYTAEGQPWLNPYWLFDWSAFQMFDKVGPTYLVVLKTILGAAAALCLLSIRHAGPTLWWTTLCVMLAAVSWSTRLIVAPDVVSVLLLTLLLLLWHQAKYAGRFSLLYAAIPLTVLWANVDMTFLLAPAVLLLWAIGETAQLALPKSLEFGSSRLAIAKIGQVLLIAGLALLGAGLLNPYGFAIVKFPFDWFTQILPNVDPIDLRLASWHRLDPNVFLDELGRWRAPWDRHAWALLAFLALGSFFLNYTNLSISRLLTVLLAIALPLVAFRFMMPSGALLAVALALNGQEFFLQTWGAEPRIERGWVLWSQIGRALTILLVFAGCFAAFTGRIQGVVGRFGFGVMEERFMADTVDWLNEIKPKGNAFVLADRGAAYYGYMQPAAKTFLDGRWQIFGAVWPEYRAAREALIKNKPELWKPIFDKYKITHVVVEPPLVNRDPRGAELLYSLLNAKELTLLKVTDQAEVFGRLDDPLDKEMVERHRLDANETVFRAERTLPDLQSRPVIAPSIFDFDWVWRQRELVPAGYSSARMLATNMLLQNAPPLASLKDPGATFLAIEQYRKALVGNPDHGDSHLEMAMAYQRLYFNFEGRALAQNERARLKLRQQKLDEAEKLRRSKDAKTSAESRVLPQVRLDPDSEPVMIQPPVALFQSPYQVLAALRHYQIMSALQNAVAAAPKSFKVHMLMFQYCAACRYQDLALHHLKQAIQFAEKEIQENLTSKYLGPLEDDVARLREQYDSALAQAEAAGQTWQPIDLAMFAFYRLGLPKLALDENLEGSASNPFSPEMAQRAATVGELYLMLGQSEKAQARFTTAQSQQQQQRAQPGQIEYYMSIVALLNGNYKVARENLELAIAKLRDERGRKGIDNFEGRLRAGILVERMMPGQSKHVGEDYVNALQSQLREAEYELLLGLCRIEMGEPQRAVEAFSAALKAYPRFACRAVIAYYWPMLTDKPLPPEQPYYDEIEGELDARFALAAVEPDSKAAKPDPPTNAAKSKDKPAITNAEKPATEKKSDKPADVKSKDRSAEPKPEKSTTEKKAEKPVPADKSTKQPAVKKS